MTAGQLLAASASYRQNLVRANNLVFPYFSLQFAHNPATKAMWGGGGEGGTASFALMGELFMVL